MKKLEFNKETISILSDNEQQELVGGTGNLTKSITYCDACPD